MSKLSSVERPLSIKILIRIFIVSGFVTLTITCIQLYVEYQADLLQVEEQFTNIEESFIPALTRASWVYDEKLIESNLEGIIHLRDIIHLSITDGPQLVSQIGEIVTEAPLKKTYPLQYSYKGTQRTLGELNVTASLSGVYERLWSRFLVVLATTASRTFIVSFFIFSIIQHLITRHLISISNAVDGLIISGHTGSLDIDRAQKPGHKIDELDRVFQALNHYTLKATEDFSTIQSELALRREAEKTLNIEKGSLEVKVQKRTQSLDEKIKELEAIKVELLEKEARIRHILNITPGIFYNFTIGVGGTYYSSQLKDILGVEVTTLLENPMFWHDSIHPEDVVKVDKAIEEIVEKGFLEVEYRIKNASNRYIWLYDKAVAEEADEGVQIFGIALDITKRRTLEQRLRNSQKMEALGTLAGGIAHDFNNLLMIIAGFTEMTCDSLEDSEEKENLEESLSACKRAKDIVNQILTYTTKAHFGEEPVDVGKTADEVIKHLSPSLPIGVQISTYLDGTCPLVLTDSSALYQVIINLLTNAIHATEKNGGVVDIHVSSRKNIELPSDWEGDYVLLEVKDNGEGMSNETLSQIFEPYFTTKGVGKGSGLGLSVVQGIVKRCKAALEVSSAPGRGTDFKIFFPVAEIQENLSIEKGFPSSGTRRLKVLLSEDEGSLVSLLYRRLTKEGFEVKKANTGQEAYDIFMRSPDDFDVIVTDQLMPGMKGTELAEKIKAIKPELPIVLITGYNPEEFLNESNLAYITEVLKKPISLKMLVQVIEQVS